ncbi:MAG TPA: TonB-dependent receptor, partial [Rudaea sp.]|nr:TonB-dependent receptor [Rudaea sp.]
TTAATGGNDGRVGWYALANHFEETGWRDLSNSNTSSALATVSWREGPASADLHLAHTESKLTGNGPQSVDLFAFAPRSVFTAPDRTQNFFSGVTAHASDKLGADVVLSATAFARRVDTRSYNGDVSSAGPCADDAAVLCDEAGTPLADPRGAPISTAYDAVDNIGVRRQSSAGGSLQAVFKEEWFGRENQFVAGIDLTHGRVDYRASAQAAYFVPFAGDPYSVVAVPGPDIAIADANLAARISETNAGAYATDTWAVSDALALTLSGRYNRTRTQIRDAGGDPDLDGDHAFHRFNPAAGLTYAFSRTLNAYAGASESTRAPTPVELTCASADAPCRLPNDFLADPPLRQVVAHSVEAGFRGDFASALHWQAGVFRTVNSHDILFQATGGAQSNQGFFANVGATRRQGADVSLSGKAADGRLDWYANATLVDATFRTAFVERSVHHPDADTAGFIAVARGDRLPGVPRRAFKAGADWALTPELAVGCGIVYNSKIYLRGDEADLLRPLGGYALANLRARYRLGAHAAVFARVDNALDRRYANFGVLGDAAVLHPAIADPHFASPGAPRAAWIGLDLDF